MHYILDGYNIIYRLPHFSSSGSIKNEREKLIKYLYKEKKHLIRKNQISVVFDGQNNFIDWQAERSSPIQILFSHRTNADDCIVDIVKRTEKQSNCGGITVVTDDKELQIRVRMLSASAIGVDEFFIPNKKEVKEQSREVEKNEPALTYKELEEIKRELICKDRQCS